VSAYTCAFLHEVVIELVAFIAAFIADIRAYTADLRIIRRVPQDKVSVYVTDSGAIHQQIDLFGFYVSTAHREASAYCFRAGLTAIKRVFEALMDLGGGHVFGALDTFKLLHGARHMASQWGLASWRPFRFV